LRLTENITDKLSLGLPNGVAVARYHVGG
jgi:hypothetical protein